MMVNERVARSIRRVRDRMRVFGCACVLVSVGACDFDVSNPGPVEDSTLDDPASFPALVNAIARSVSIALGEVAVQSGAVTREIMASGNLNINLAHGQGLFTPEDSGNLWSDIQQARWIGDAIVGRLGEAGAEPEILSEAHLWAGYASRFGENLCQAVLDGGPAEPYTVMLDNAVEHFTRAMELSLDPDIRMAAVAGRATVHMSLGDWAAAVADANQVPDDFVFQARFSGEEQSQRNQIFYFVANQPYRVHSVWGTPFEQYFLDTGDPRTPWDEDPDFPVGEVQRPGIGSVPWKFQTKYTTYNDPMNLASGREMRLIEAEALLNAGQWVEAMTLVNRIRMTNVSLKTGQPLEPWTPTNLEEAWTAFRRERGIELWLEGRRLNDLRRWKQAGAPGELHPLEDPSNPATYLSPNQTLCIPISQAERETNNNLTT